MILYHVVSTYQLLNAILCSRKSTEKKVLACSKWLFEKFPEIVTLKYFDDIKLIDANYRFFHKMNDSTKYYEALLGDLKKYSTIYLWGAHFSLGVLLEELYIKYIFCEDAAGLLSRPEILKNIDEQDKLKHTYQKSIDQKGLYDGTGINAEGVLCNVNAQKNEFLLNDKVINFNVIDELRTLEKTNLEEILSFFKVNNQIIVEDNSTLILTQHLANMRVVSLEQQILLYQILVDYFFIDEKIIFKPHPDDLVYYELLFPECRIIKERFPAEFIPFIFDKDLRCVATVSSTSIFNLKCQYERIFELDPTYEKDFEKTHRYFIVMLLVKMFNKKTKCLNCNIQLVRRLSEVLSVDNLLDNSCNITTNDNIFIVDDYTTEKENEKSKILMLLQNLEDDDCVIFINSHDEYCWYDYYHRELWNNIIPVVLKKEVHQPQSEDFYADTEDEVIYVYSKNKELLNMVREVEMDKVLPHTGITVRKEILTSEQERIKMLEGILEATEKRLLYYIEKENQNK